MNSAIERIVGLRVKDVMNREVITVLDTEPMQNAAKRIFDAEVSGAPVVNDRGECVGVLSSSDFVGRDAGRHALQVVSQSGSEEPVRVDCLDDDVVSAHMTPLVQTISDDALILGAARTMCQEGIHRLIVVDAKNHPIAIVSTLDLVAAIVAAIEE